MKPVNKAILELHIAVFLFGFTAILGRLIDLPAVVIVWWRVLFTCISLLFLVRINTVIRDIPRGLLLRYMGIGWLVAAHWLCFYGAIKMSNASITLICLALTSLFTSIVEPLFLKQRIKPFELFLGMLVVPGMALIVQHIDWSMIYGVWLGILSALFGTLFSVLNKKFITRAEPLSITLIELGSGSILLSLGVMGYILSEPQVAFWPSWSDLVYLLVLALLCTTLAYVLSLRALRYLSAFASNLTINLEPVYGIILAILILRENKELSPQFYLGVLLILGTVFCYPLLKKRFEKRSTEAGGEDEILPG